MFEAVRIRQSGFPFRYTHHEFVWRYQCLLHGHNTRGMHDEDICTAIINAMGADWEDIQVRGSFFFFFFFFCVCYIRFANVCLPSLTRPRPNNPFCTIDRLV